MTTNNRWSLSRLLSNNSQTAAEPQPQTYYPTAATSRSSGTTTGLTGNNSMYPRQARQPQSGPSRQQRTQTMYNPHSRNHARSTNAQNPSSHSDTSGTVRGRQTTATHSNRNEPELKLSNFSTPVIPDSVWFAEDFMLGAGMVIIQPSSGKIVLLYERRTSQSGQHYDSWFLPKGRKDVGESLEQTALREAHEESGYRVSFLPVIMKHNAPNAPNATENYLSPVTEPIFISTLAYQRGQGGREYLTFWYLGQISDDAVIEADTRMSDEVGYQTFLVTYEEALQRLANIPTYLRIVRIAYAVWRKSVQIQSDPAYEQYMAPIAAERAQPIDVAPQEGA